MDQKERRMSTGGVEQKRKMKIKHVGFFLLKIEILI
jgi:hypothetical protein